MKLLPFGEIIKKIELGMKKKRRKEWPKDKGQNNQ